LIGGGMVTNVSISEMRLRFAAVTVRPREMKSLYLLGALLRA
jgi:hypothetical protein